jgi:spore germination protein KC
VKRIIAFFLSAVFMAGCWDSRDIQAYNIALAVFLDHSEQDDLYKMYIEIAKTVGDSKQEEGGNSRSILLGEGYTIDHARQRLDKESDNPLYLDATRVLVMGENFARRGIEGYLNRIRGTAGYRKNVALYVTDIEDIKEATVLEPDNNIYLGMSMERSKQQNIDMGSGFTTNVQDALQAVAAGNPSFLVPMITKVSDMNPQLSGYAIFDDCKMIGRIPTEDSRALSFLMNKKAAENYATVLDGETSYFIVRGKKLDVIPGFDGEKVYFDVILGADCTFFYPETFRRFSPQELSVMVEDVRSQAGRDLEDTIYLAQNEYGCDYLGFYRIFKAKFGSLYDSLDWKQAFREAEIRVNVTARFAGSEMLGVEM